MAPKDYWLNRTRAVDEFTRLAETLGVLFIESQALRWKPAVYLWFDFLCWTFNYCQMRPRLKHTLFDMGSVYNKAKSDANKNKLQIVNCLCNHVCLWRELTTVCSVGVLWVCYDQVLWWLVVSYMTQTGNASSLVSSCRYLLAPDCVRYHAISKHDSVPVC